MKINDIASLERLGGLKECLVLIGVFPKELAL